MDKIEIINYWLKSAINDQKAMDTLFKAGDYVWALFLAHLILEKTLKARWIFDNNGTVPPKTHNLDKLARETKHPFSEEQLIWMVQANDFNIQTRYPDYKLEFYNKANAEFTAVNLQKAKEIIQCICEKLHFGMQNIS